MRLVKNSGFFCNTQQLPEYCCKRRISMRSDKRQLLRQRRAKACKGLNRKNPNEFDSFGFFFRAFPPDRRQRIFYENPTLANAAGPSAHELRLLKSRPNRRLLQKATPKTFNYRRGQSVTTDAAKTASRTEQFQATAIRPLPTFRPKEATHPPTKWSHPSGFR